MNTQHENTIHFMTGEDSKCVMRIEANRIWVDPDIEKDEVAKVVIEALQAQINLMVSKAVEAEREECAKVCEEMWAGGYGPSAITAAIRSRSKHG